jgi:hypothetical protein
MKRLPITVLSLALALPLFAAGCSDDPAAPATRPDCEAIVERCHPLDPGSGPIHECHENAEGASVTNAQCAATRASCFAVCVATDAGADAGSSDSGSSDAQAHE